MATMLPYAVAATMGPQMPQAQAPAMPSGFDPNDPYAAQVAALQAKLAQPLQRMYSPEQIQQRQADNQRQYELGILGQLSGDQDAGAIGGQVLKQALAARQPKITERGTADQITGEFAYDPDYLRSKDETMLSGLQQRQAQADQQRQLAGQAAQDRKDLAAQRAADQMESRRLAAGIAQGNRQGADDARTWHAEDTLRNNFEKNTKPLQDQLNEIDKLQATLGGYAGRRMDPLAQQSVVILLNKFLDPGSVVREGEFDRVVKSQGLEGTARMLGDKVLKGDILSPAAIQQINGLAQVYQKAALSKMGQHATQIGNVAKARGLDLNNVITDPRFQPTGQGGAPAAAHDPLGLR